MSKRQKQLYNTYFRQRENAIDRINQYKTYELIYFIENNIEVKLDKFMVFDMLLYSKKFKDKLSPEHYNMLSNAHITYLLAWVDDEYINYFSEDSINSLTETNIHEILSQKPQLVDRLPLENLSGYYIIAILFHQPQLVDKLPIEKLDMEKITQDGNTFFYLRNLLRKYPDLKIKFKERGLI